MDIPPNDQPPPYGPPPPPYQQGAYQQGPYAQGPYAQGAYPQPWGPPQPPPSMNGMAVASLVLAVCCGPVLGVVFGFIALAQIRRRGDAGKGLAIAGIVVSGVVTLFLAAVIALGVAGYLDNNPKRGGDGQVTGAGTSSTTEIRVGDCFNTKGDSLGDYSGAGAQSSEVTLVPCSTAHDAEAFAVFDLQPAKSYPGEARVSKVAEGKCSTLADDYVKGGAKAADSLDIYYYMPQRIGWSRGDRSVTCFFGGTNGKLTGSLKGGPENTGTAA